MFHALPKKPFSKTILETGRNKRKLLNQPACEVETALLKRALSQFCGRRNFDMFWDLLVQSSVYLSHKCQNLLKKQWCLGTIKAKCV